MMTSIKGTAVVAGASPGIGAIYADRLARRGYDLLQVARRRGRLDGLAKYLRDTTGRSIEVVAPISTTPSISPVLKRYCATAPTSGMLVNNAGVGAIGSLLSSDIGKMCEMIARNVTALTRLVYAAAPGFATRGGTIINIASAVGIAPEILNGVFGGTKTFVLALTLSLHNELADKNVRQSGLNVKPA